MHKLDETSINYRINVDDARVLLRLLNNMQLKSCKSLMNLTLTLSESDKLHLSYLRDIFRTDLEE